MINTKNTIKRIINKRRTVRRQDNDNESQLDLNTIIVFKIEKDIGMKNSKNYRIGRNRILQLYQMEEFIDGKWVVIDQTESLRTFRDWNENLRHSSSSSRIMKNLLGQLRGK